MAKRQDGMDPSSATREAVDLRALEQASAVETQKAAVHAMRPGDPGMPFARVMLSLMEQTASMAEMNRAFDPPPDGP